MNDIFALFDYEARILMTLFTVLVINFSNELHFEIETKSFVFKYLRLVYTVAALPAP